MPKRQYANPMQHRQYLNTNCSTYDKIYGRYCYHIDAWMYQLPNDTMYLIMESRAGGQQLIDRRVYRMEPGKLIPVRDSEQDKTGIRRYVGTAWTRKNAPWLDALHWHLIQPTLRVMRPGYRGMPSVRLHYVWSDMRIDDPMAGVQNTYGASGRVGRDGIAQPAIMPAALVYKWSARERSLLRTLDKILR